MEASGPDRGEDDRARSTREEAIDAAPGLARLTVTAWVRTAEWTLGSTVRAGRFAARAVISGESVPDLIDEARANLRSVLGVNEIEERIAGLLSGGQGTDKHAPLRDRGAELLQSSADVLDGAPLHPAYENILADLAPDEARILRLLAGAGPQATVDVRTYRPLDVGSRLVAQGLSMIGRNAGVQFADSVPQYLNNLNRLGLIWFSREPLESSTAAYQVLEAQPDVLEAIKRTGRARVVRRSVKLTAFGRDFCDVALPEDAGPPTGEFATVAAEPAGEPDAEPAGEPDSGGS
jgi:Abortive infection alpha